MSPTSSLCHVALLNQEAIVASAYYLDQESGEAAIPGRARDPAQTAPHAQPTLVRRAALFLEKSARKRSAYRPAIPPPPAQFRVLAVLSGAAFPPLPERDGPPQGYPGPQPPLPAASVCAWLEGAAPVATDVPAAAPSASPVRYQSHTTRLSFSLPRRVKR